MTPTRIALITSAALLVFWALGAYNRLVRLRSAVMGAWPPLEAQLRRRQALTFELTELLGSLNPMENLSDEIGRATLQTVAAAARQAQAAVDHAQGRVGSAGAIQSLGLAEQVLEGALRPLRVLIAARPAVAGEPELGERVRALLLGLQEADAQLAFVRRVFNEAVEAFNGAVHELPTRLISSVFGFRAAAPLASASPDRGPDSQIASTFGERA
ncbi:MAG: LemA family protein [Methylibium sp.]|uniref:LemA family protein n=1 Tax=Methylibium sp. TaxID=2067992 RepID=UPI00182CCE09|nr:LemA family protein [Methylibium sp.]MBA3599181.1 LemA family protein [Methylibium sp.]